MRYYLLFLCLCISITLPAQHLQWATRLGDTLLDGGRATATDAAGNLITAGVFNGTIDLDPGAGIFNLSGSGVYVQKLDSAGSFIWAKYIGGAGCNNVTLDAAGNILIAGLFAGTQDFDPGPGVFNLTSSGNADGFVLKLDAAGGLIWAKNMGDNAYSLALDGVGNIYVTGWFYDTTDFDPGPAVFNLMSANNNNIFVLKLDASGDFIWAAGLGSIDDDRGYSIAADYSGGIYISGAYKGTVDFDPGTASFFLSASGITPEIFLLKIDTAGNFLWAQNEGSDQSYFAGIQLAIDSADRVYLAGAIGSTMFIRKIDGSGSQIWNREMSAPDNGAINAITIDDTANIYTAGYFSGGVDFDPDPVSVYILNTSIPGESWGVFVQKLDSSGSFKWAGNMGGNAMTFSEGTALAVDHRGNIFVTGEFNSVQDFDPGLGTTNLSSVGDLDVFLLRISQQYCVLPPAPVSISGDTVLCYQSQVTYSVSPVPGATSYSWTFPQGWAGGWPGGDTMSTSAGVSGVIKVNANNNCGSGDSISLTVTVHPLPNPVIAANGTLLSIATPFSSYQWYLDNLAIPGATNASYLASANGIYHLSVTDSNGCSNTSNHLLITSLAIDNTAGNDQLSVYPNPGSGLFTIENGSDKVLSITVSDIDGRVITRQSLQKGKQVLDLTACSGGIYLIKAGAKTIRLLKL